MQDHPLLTPCPGVACLILPGASLTSHLSALAEGHLAGLQQLNSNTATATPQFLTPVNSSRHGDYIEPAGQLAVNPGSSSASGGQTAASPADKRAAAGASRRLIDKLKRRTTAETQQAPGIASSRMSCQVDTCTPLLVICCLQTLAAVSSTAPLPQYLLAVA